MRPAPRVLVMRRGGLGDALCFLPVLEAGHRTWPDAEIVFAGTSEVAELFATRGPVTRGVSIESLDLWGLAASPPARARCLARLMPFDHIVGEIEVASLPPEWRARAVAFDLVVDARAAVPAAAQLLTRARAVWPAPWPDVQPAPRLAAERAPSDARHIWIHPGAGSPRKSWSKWPEAIGTLLGHGWRCTVSFGEADAELRARLDPVLPREVDRFADRSLVDLARGLEHAAVYAGNDSGVSHLACALGVPAVVLFGPTPPQVWAPPGARVLTFAASAGDVVRCAHDLAASTAGAG